VKQYLWQTAIITGDDVGRITRPISALVYVKQHLWQTAIVTSDDVDKINSFYFSSCLSSYQAPIFTCIRKVYKAYILVRRDRKNENQIQIHSLHEFDRILVNSLSMALPTASFIHLDDDDVESTVLSMLDSSLFSSHESPQPNTQSSSQSNSIQNILKWKRKHTATGTWFHARKPHLNEAE